MRGKAGIMRIELTSTETKRHSRFEIKEAQEEKRESSEDDELDISGRKAESDLEENQNQEEQGKKLLYQNIVGKVLILRNVHGKEKENRAVRREGKKEKRRKKKLLRCKPGFMIIFHSR